ncbi:MAG: M1 family metallopeptidase [Saprospiraceae bacterium]|nr:M1 family metallopeptidase [Saprospiraceae bacterium]
MIRSILYIAFIAILFPLSIRSQGNSFTYKDSLRGAMRKEREFDVTHYDLHVKINPDKKFIEGYNTISYVGKTDCNELQVDLFENMKILSIKAGSTNLKYRRIFDAIFIDYPIRLDKKDKITIEFEGNPIVAKNAPWDGGFVFSKDQNGDHWIGVACEGTGASLWWPNKDHLSEEPQNMDIYVTAPKGYMAISNGKLIDEQKSGKNNTTYHWHVSYPINNYNVTVYIGKYTHFTEEMKTLSNEKLMLNYYVLQYNLDKAKTHFEQTKKMLESFDNYCGTYPFINDGYSLVEAPYLGMEHQSAIAYGNEFLRGYKGERIPDHLHFDFIILHESGHEYWGNSVSCTDHSEMWIHEGFTTYMESLYVEYMYGKEEGLKYLEYQKPFIKNNAPLLGPKDVNFDGNSSDIYYKGAWILQTLRKSLSNDTLFFKIFKGFYDKHKYGFATTMDFVDYVNLSSGFDYSAFFRQYLKHKPLPKLIYKIGHRDNYTSILYKWDCLESQFTFPVEFELDGKKIRLEPGFDWKNIEFNRNFKNVKPITRGLLINVEEQKM